MNGSNKTHEYFMLFPFASTYLLRFKNFSHYVTTVNDYRLKFPMIMLNILPPFNLRLVLTSLKQDSKICKTKHLNAFFISLDFMNSKIVFLY